jgi:hypothetical protein
VPPSVQCVQFSGLTVEGTGTGKFNANSVQCWSPNFDMDGWYQNDGTAAYVWTCITVPSFVTNCVVTYKASTDALVTNYWDDIFQAQYNSSDGRALFGANIHATVLTTNRVPTTISATIAWPFTNASKYFWWASAPGTNVNRRAIIGPAMLTLR